ncbi:hypothetical protein [Burkholderia sp. Ac-20353]|uniref:hypothetical protein n=1 Tax=Burkholderia sp. Ac-20353 TaxID=2703894 RepID=UPI00197BCD9F|nr:hypothetical protein [Burkholderia sp. Ac-20353]MBN3789307.1 hypothetical protein [Burkholderia sp. Ac-20353]
MINRHLAYEGLKFADWAGTPEEARAEALRIWRASGAPVNLENSCASLRLMRVGPHGLRQSGRDLIAAVFRGDEVFGIELIEPSGWRTFLGDFTQHGAHGVILAADDIGDGAPLLITSTWGSAAALHEATGYAIWFAMTERNMPAVLRRAREQFRDRQLFVCDRPSSDASSDLHETIGRTAARLITPTIRTEDATDSFEAASMRWGVSAVRELVDRALPPVPATSECAAQGEGKGTRYPPKLWEAIRREWEADPKLSYAAAVKIVGERLGVPVPSKGACATYATRNNWAKAGEQVRSPHPA